MSTKLPYPLAMLQRGESHDPFSVLGRQPDGDGILVRAFLPNAEEVELEGVGRDAAGTAYRYFRAPAQR